MLVLRELAVSAPTFFFQQVQPFFDNIFYAVWDPKQAIREGAVSALRACLILTTQRETKEMQKPQWYKVGPTPPGLTDPRVARPPQPPRPPGDLLLAGGQFEDVLCCKGFCFLGFFCSETQV